MPDNERGRRFSDVRKAFGRPWILPLAVVIALLVGVLVGAWFDPFNLGDQVRPPQPPRPIHIEGRYVALGDSYAAGEGLAPWQPGTQNTGRKGDRCHRSLKTSYSVDLVFDAPPSRIDYRACSGAISADVFDEVQLHDGVPDFQGKQVEPGILGADVALITLTMGGNDVHFANVLNTCFKISDCVNQPYQGAPTLHDWISEQLGILKDELLGLYKRLRTEAPNARILIVGYPALFPEKAPPFLSPHNETCSLLLSHWEPSERDAIRAWGLQLNGIIQQDARAAEVDYVDVFPFFAGHEPCGPSGAWIRFVGVSLDSSVRDGSFHPTIDGQNQIARIVSCYLTVYPSYPSGITGTQAERFEMNGCIAEAAPPSPAPPSP